MDEQKHHDPPGHAHVHGSITMKAAAERHAKPDDEDGHSHPTWKFYVMIGLVLTIITAVEVAIFYIPQLAAVLVPTLIVLSVAKFVIVVMFYMHLKFDSAVFSRVFFAPLFLAVLVVVGLIILFKVLPAYDVWR
jgi:cytochrome c oxidase subunit 4